MKQNYYEGYELDLDRLENIIVHLENDELCDFMIGIEPLYLQLEELLTEISGKLKEIGITKKKDLSDKLKDLQQRAFLIILKQE